MIGLSTSDKQSATARISQSRASSHLHGLSFSRLLLRNNHRAQSVGNHHVRFESSADLDHDDCKMLIYASTGLAGFEPANAAVKVLCLPAWR